MIQNLVRGDAKMNQGIKKEKVVEGICIQERPALDDHGKEIEGQVVEHRCDRIIEQEQTCIAYMDPRVWGRRGGCPMCSIPPLRTQQKEKQTNFLKASKRKARGK